MVLHVLVHPTKVQGLWDARQGPNKALSAFFQSFKGPYHALKGSHKLLIIWFYYNYISLFKRFSVVKYLNVIVNKTCSDQLYKRTSHHLLNYTRNCFLLLKNHSGRYPTPNHSKKHSHAVLREFVHATSRCWNSLPLEFHTRCSSFLDTW